MSGNKEETKTGVGRLKEGEVVRASEMDDKGVERIEGVREGLLEAD